MLSWWKEISSGSADSLLGSQLTCAALSCDGGCLRLALTSKNMEGTGGVHEDVKALPWGVIKKLRKGMLMLQRSLGNATEEQEIVHWGGIGHKGILNSKHLWCQIWYNILRKPKACRSAAQTNYCPPCVRLLQQFLVRHTQPHFYSFLLSSTPFYSFLLLSQDLLPTFIPFCCLLTWSIQAFTAWFQVVICVFCVYYGICSSYQSGPRERDGFVLMHLQAETHLCSGIYWNAIIKDVTLFPSLKIPLLLLADCLEFAKQIFGKSCSLIISVSDF